MSRYYADTDDLRRILRPMNREELAKRDRLDLDLRLATPPTRSSS